MAVLTPNIIVPCIDYCNLIHLQHLHKWKPLRWLKKYAKSWVRILSLFWIRQISWTEKNWNQTWEIATTPKEPWPAFWLLRYFHDETCPSMGDRGQTHLSREQRFALQKAFLRQIRSGFPRGFYRLSDTKQPWHTGTSQGQLFHRPCIFHVAAPMNRYIAPLKKQLFLWKVGKLWKEHMVFFFKKMHRNFALVMKSQQSNNHDSKSGMSFFGFQGCEIDIEHIRQYIEDMMFSFKLHISSQSMMMR